MTFGLRFQRHFSSTPVCPRCEQCEETPLHVLRDCYHSRLIWESSCALTEDFFTLELEDWLRINTATSPLSGSSSTSWITYFLSAIWIIWKSQNALIFEGTRTPPHILHQRACNLAKDTRLALVSNAITHVRVPKWVRWHPPEFPFLKLNIDGAMNHSTGKASAGGLFCDHRGRWLYGFTVNIGPQSSYMAELWSCRDGLRIASELGITHLIVEMDSIMAVQMIQGRKVGEGAASVLLSDIFHYLDSFAAYKVQHTLRKGNAAADYMASMGYIYLQGLTLFQSPSLGISCILYGDVIGTSFLRI